MKYNEKEISERLGFDTLEPETAEIMLESFYETLETRVMMAAYGKFSPEQLEEFEAADDEGKDKLLQSVIADPDKLVDEETDKLLKVIDDNAAKMINDK